MGVQVPPPTRSLTCTLPRFATSRRDVHHGLHHIGLAEVRPGERPVVLERPEALLRSKPQPEPERRFDAPHAERE